MGSVGGHRSGVAWLGGDRLCALDSAGGFHDLLDSLEFFRFRLRQSHRKDRLPPEPESSRHRGDPRGRTVGRLFILIGALINVVTAPFARGSPSGASGLDPYQPEMAMTIEAEQVSTDEAVVSALTDEPHDTMLGQHLIDVGESDQQHYAEVLTQLRQHVRAARIGQPGAAAKADELATRIRQGRVRGRVARRFGGQLILVRLGFRKIR